MTKTGGIKNLDTFFVFLALDMNGVLGLKDRGNMFVSLLSGAEVDINCEHVLERTNGVILVISRASLTYFFLQYVFSLAVADSHSPVNPDTHTSAATCAAQLIPTPDLKDELMQKGYHKEISLKIARDRPELAREILNTNIASEPITVFRGLTVSLEAFNPGQVRGIGRQYSASLGSTENAWTSSIFSIAWSHALECKGRSGRAYAKGIVVEYQIPRFMFVSGGLMGDPPRGEILPLDPASGQISQYGQISGRYLESNQLPFILRIAVLNGEPVKTKLKGETPLEPHLYIASWITP